MTFPPTLCVFNRQCSLFEFYWSRFFSKELTQSSIKLLKSNEFVRFLKNNNHEISRKTRHFNRSVLLYSPNSFLKCNLQDKQIVIKLFTHHSAFYPYLFPPTFDQSVLYLLLFWLITCCLRNCNVVVSVVGFLARQMLLYFSCTVRET